MDDRTKNVPPARGRTPTGEEAAALHKRVAAIQRVLDSAGQEGVGAGIAASEQLLREYRPRLAATMTALGETLADFFEESAEPVDLAVLRSEYLEPILVLSRALPVFRRAEAWARSGAETAELHRLLFEGRRVLFDGPSALLSDFYLQSAGAASLRTRAVAIMDLVQKRVTARRADWRPLRVVALGANSILAADPDRDLHHALPGVSLLIVDDDTDALRRARQRVQDVLGVRPAVLLANPRYFAHHPGRPAESFDLIYTLTLFDTLSPAAGLSFTRSIEPMLNPGGALLTGCYLPVISRASRALALALIGMQWEYWDEPAWRQMLASLAFDVDSCEFEMYPPATLVVLARRKRE